jgi:hypothetical protein
VSAILQSWQARAKSIAHSWDDAKIASLRNERGSLWSKYDKLIGISSLARGLEVLPRDGSVAKATQALEASCERSDPLDRWLTRQLPYLLGELRRVFGDRPYLSEGHYEVPVILEWQMHHCKGASSLNKLGSTESS